MDIKVSNTRKMTQVELQKTALDILMKSSKKAICVHKDTYDNSKLYDDKKSKLYNDIGVYSVKKVKQVKYISKELLDRLNDMTSSFIESGGVYEFEGVFFTADQIPEISASSLPEVTASNNVIDFGKYSYFKYVDKKGVDHALFAGSDDVDTLCSERLRGAGYDPVAEDYTSFWNYMASEDPTFYWLQWDQTQVRDKMSEAGIHTGFFTVKIGDRETTQYYSATLTGGEIHSKSDYDWQYKHMTSTGYTFTGYEPGSVFTLNGKEYVLSENQTLDLPYGADLWCLEYPKNYRCGVKIH